MIEGLQPYPVYKDSGVPWLGDLPEDWGTIPGRALFREINDRGHPDEELLSVTISRGVVRQVEFLANSSKKDSSNEDKATYKLVQPGDIVYNKMRAWQGALGVSARRGIVSPAYIVQRPRNPENSPRFLHYLLRTPAFATEAERWSYGITSDQWSLRAEDFRKLHFAVPPLVEQVAIARFLDWVDRRIRGVISARQKRIGLLDEFKRALVRRAVTGQIDVRTNQSYPAYKHSDVEWLGEVPEHWEIRQIRRCGAVTGGMTPSMDNPRYWGGTIPWVTPKDMKRTDIGDSSIRVTEAALQETSLRLIEPPAVLIVVRGMILAKIVPSAWTTARVTINQDMKALKPAGGIDSKFLVSLLDAAQEALVPLIDESGHGTRRLPTNRWLKLEIVVPPTHEQSLIVEFLNDKIAGIDVAISADRREIALLKELQIRLVADVVTGKVDVRGVARSLPEEPRVHEPEPVDEEELVQVVDSVHEEDPEAVFEGVVP